MSFANSRWNSQLRPAAATSSTDSLPPKLPPHSRPASSSTHPSRLNNGPQGSSHRPSRQLDKKPPKSNGGGSGITIGAQDRLASRKFTKAPGHPSSVVAPPQLHGIIKSFNDSLTLQSSTIDPMTLVASPSRGLDTGPANANLPGQDLTDHAFQLRFFEWLANKIVHHERSHPDRLAPAVAVCRPTPQPTDSGSVGKQKESAGNLVREIRKLREGVVSSARRDWFAILVYELSAELALESSDFAQLNSLLPHLIFDLYRHVSITEQLEGHHQKRVQLAGDSAALADRTGTSAESVEARRVMFASVMLLLPLATRLAHREFLAQYEAVCVLFAPSAVCAADGGLLMLTKDQRLQGVAHIAQAVRRRNWVRLHKMAMPLVARALSTPAEARWDAVLLFHLLARFRAQVVWERIKKSYYSINDDAFLARALALSVLHPASPKDAVDEWLAETGMHRSETGAVVFK